MSAAAGFSLIEMAVGTLVLGLIAAALIAPYNLYRNNKLQLSNQRNIDIITSALAAHIERTGAYPCPAPAAAVPGTAAFGRGACVGGINAVTVGTVPVFDLNLPYQAMADAYGSRITYAVTNALTDADPANDFAGATGPGRIQVLDGNAAGLPPAMNRDAAFILVIHGVDRKGARSLETGAVIMPCGNTARDFRNCDGDRVFVDANMSLTNNPADANYYDDTVVYMLNRQENAAWMAGRFSGSLSNRNLANVGIGTDAPLATLHVSPGATPLGMVVEGATGGSVMAEQDVTATRARARAFFYCNPAVAGDCD